MQCMYAYAFNSLLILYSSIHSYDTAVVRCMVVRYDVLYCSVLKCAVFQYVSMSCRTLVLYYQLMPSHAISMHFMSYCNVWCQECCRH